MATAVSVSDGVSKTVMSAGNGPEVRKGDTITVHCTGILAESNKKFWRFDIHSGAYINPACVVLRL